MLQVTGKNFNFLESKEFVFKLTMTKDGANGRK